MCDRIDMMTDLHRKERKKYRRMEFIDANKIEAIFDSRKKNTNLHHVSAHRTNVRYPNQLHR